MAASMWRLQRYYLKELLINGGITFLVLFAIVVVSLVARGIQRAQGGDLFDAAVITLFWALDMFPHLLPISFLIATVLTFARASQDREITAVRAAGISPRVPMTAVALVGALLATVGSFSTHFLLPEVHFRKYRVIAQVVRDVVTSMGLGSGDDRISIPGTDVALTYGRREQQQGVGDTVVYYDCWLYLPDDRVQALGFVSPIVHVDRVSVPLSDDPESTRLRIVLDNTTDPLRHVMIERLEPRFPIGGIFEVARRDERDDDISSSQLLSEVVRGVHERPTAAEFTLHRRTCFAVLPLLLGPIGFCIALLARERGKALALVLAMVPLLLFYAGDVLGAKLLRVTDQPLCGWFPAALLLGLGLPFCWRELRR